MIATYNSLSGFEGLYGSRRGFQSAASTSMSTALDSLSFSFSSFEIFGSELVRSIRSYHPN